MKHLCACIALVFASLVSAQTGPVQGLSYLGGIQATTQGSKSTNYLNGIIPHATITVYLTGTLTLATGLTSDGSVPLANPFTSNALTGIPPGGWIFYAACQGYDVVASGGIAPNTYPAPVTLFKNQTPSGCGGGGGAQTIIQVNGTPTSPVSPVNFVNSASVTWTRTGATISATASVAGVAHAWPILSWSGATPDNQTLAGILAANEIVTPITPTCGAGFTWPGTNGGSAPIATASTVFTIFDQTSSLAVCTLTFGIGQSVAVASVPGGAETTIPSGDQIVIQAPTTHDATLSNITLILYGTTPDGGGGGGGIGYPAGTGIPEVTAGTSWGATYNAANLIPANFLSLIPLAGGVSGLLPIANGGTGTATPSLISGVGITISGSWPNQTVTATGGGGGGMIWPSQPGIANCTGTPCTSWLTSYSSSNQIPANFISILNQPTTGNAGTATALASAPTLCTGGNVAIGILANGNATGCTAPGGSPLWSSLLNPTAPLALSMGNSNTTTWTVGAATSTNTMFKWTDTASNTGTGILARFTTAASSTAIPWQADANGVGWQVTATGALKAVGSTVAGTISLPQGTAPGAAPANSIQMYAPTSVTAYNLVLPAAVASGSNTFLSCTAASPSVCTWAAGGGGGSGYQYSVLTAPPAVGGFTHINFQSGTTITQDATTSVIEMAVAFNSSLNWQLATASVPSTPWRVQAHIALAQFNQNNAPANTSTGGLYISDGTKLEGIEIVSQANNSGAIQDQIRVEEMNSVTSDQGQIYGAFVNTPSTAPARGMYLAFCDDGTNIKAEFSLNGTLWHALSSQAVGAWLTPTTAGVGGLVAATSTITEYVSLDGWQIQTTSVTCN